MESRFFSENYNAFREYEEAINAFDATADDDELIQIIKTAISAATFNRDEYDALTPYTTRKQGRALLEAMAEPLDREKLERASYFLGAFVREATLTKDSRTGSEQTVLDYFLGKPDPRSDDDWIGYGFDYVRYALPSALLEEKFKLIRGLSEKISEEKRGAAEYLGQLEGRIKSYRSELQKLASEFNFVGLSHAFKELLAQKSSEKNSFRNTMVALGLVAVSIPVLLLSPLREWLGLSVSAWAPGTVSRLVGVLGAELLLLYFFRIALKGYLTARNQVTNLQLRLALCTFIEGYLEFAAKAAESTQSKGIAGFESLIFSDLPADDGRIPSTFDGVEQLVGALSLMRK